MKGSGGQVDKWWACDWRSPVQIPVLVLRKGKKPVVVARREVRTGKGPEGL